MIKRESLRLSNMTKDFLDFARLESGREKLDRKPIALAEIIKDVVQIARPQAEARGIVIHTSISTDVPSIAANPALIGDSDRIKQVILNLVSNATKYNTEDGQIKIEAERGDSQVRVSVSDTGHGIAEEDVTHLFERFYRVPGSEELSEGSGMGLAIASKIVEAHGGRIEVSSVPEQGTTFTIYLPLTAQ
jgi:signal transduction histidine kinase